MTENRSSYSKYIRWFWAIFAFPFVLVITIFILINLEVFGPMPGFEELENPENNLAAEVYSNDGVLLGKFYLPSQNRTWTDYEDISPYMIAALISTEDIRFHRHSGIDVRALARVAVKTVLMGQSTGGGSTITQQLAKQLYKTREQMTGISTPTGKLNLVIAKFKEWSTAVRLERNYTKEEIIAMYLNNYDFLYTAVGVRSASEVYFNSSPDSLKMEEAATLVGMLKNSSLYNPMRDSALMLNRRNIVLSQMSRYGYIKKEVADSLKQLPIELDFREQSHDTGLATYLREYIKLTMIKYEPERRNFLFEADYEDARKEWDNNPLYGWCRKNLKPDGTNYNLYRDGLKIYTTIDSRMQKYAEEAVTEHLGENLQGTFNNSVRNNLRPPYSNDITAEEYRSIMDASVKRTDRYRALREAGMSEDSIRMVFNTRIPMKLFSYKGEIDTIMSPYDSVLYYKYIVRSSMMAMDPHNGYVKAYVGGPDFRYFKYDAVTQQRKQVGSTIKPFLYTLAIQDGYSPCYEVENIPRQFEVGDSTWSPRSSGPREYHGKMVTLRWGLAQSENYISAWLMKQFAPGAVVDLMGRMGINTRYVEPVPSIFLGTGIITLKEMVGAFGTFANKGVYNEPVFVSRIEDRNGNLISTFIPGIEEVMSEDHAYLMLDLLQGVTNRGTGIRMRTTYNLYNQLGGKTGTTQNHSNGWYMSVAPNLVGGVWTGWEDQSIHFENLSLGQGANMALPVYGLFLQKVYSDPELGIMELDEFEIPPGFDMELDCDKLKSESAVRDRYRLERF